MMNFSDDEITTIRAAARVVYERLIKEYTAELAAEVSIYSFAVLPEITIENIVESVAWDTDVEDVLESWGKGDLADLFAELRPEEVMELLAPEFNVQ